MAEFDKKQGNYFFLPKWICQSDLLPVCKILLGRIFVLTSYGKNECYCKDKVMAVELGLGERTIAKAISILKQDKYLSVRIVKDNFSRQRMVGLGEKSLKNPAQVADTLCTECSTDTAQNTETILQDMQKPNTSTLQDVHDSSCKMCSLDPAQVAVNTLHNVQDTNKNIQTRNTNKNNNLENIYGENSKNETDLHNNSITKSSSHEFSEDGSENPEEGDSGQGQTLEEVCTVFEKPERGALSDTQRDLRKSSAAVAPKQSKKTIPSDVDEVVNFMSFYLDKNQNTYPYFSTIDPVKAANTFFDYYESNGWKVGKNPMKNWQAAAGRCLREWSSVRNTKLLTNSGKPKIERKPFFTDELTTKQTIDVEATVVDESKFLENF